MNFKILPPLTCYTLFKGYELGDQTHMADSKKSCNELLD